MHDPISTLNGNLCSALYGSFLPVPSNDLFPILDPSQYLPKNAPGFIDVKQERICINQGRERIRLRVTNDGDRPIQVSLSLLSVHATNRCVLYSQPLQVGSHYHFIETNPKLSFDRGKAYGRRLDIPAGTAVRFEPGERKTVTLCAIAGDMKISGGNRLATGVFDPSRTDEIVVNLMRGGFAHVPEPGALEVCEDTFIEREAYVAMFGPTVGDRVRLGDTELWIEVECDNVSLAFDGSVRK